MNKRIEQNDSAIICDNTECDYKTEANVPFIELEKYINRPCPLCGENLLTEEDYKNCETLQTYIDFVNDLTEEEYEALVPKSAEKEEGVTYSMSIGTHKKLTVEKIEKHKK